MITEDYVSFETAKLLKEKGFDLECDYLYVDGEIRRAQGYACNWNSGETILTDYVNECSAPTLQMAMKWLREVHNIHVVPKFDFYAGYYTGRIYDGRRESTAEKDDYISIVGNSTYEKACEVAIKYCLENLI